MRATPERLAWASIRFWVAVGALGVAAVALRMLLMIGYSPAILSYPDEGSYVGAAAGQLFSNPFRPAGYSLFLRLVHLVAANLVVTIAVQHVLGLATAVAVYALARRIGCDRWVALLPTSLVALSGDNLYLEHVLLSDSLYTGVLVLACVCALGVLGAPREATKCRGLGWGVAAGALAGALATVRTIGVLFGGVLILWLLVSAGAGWRRRLAAAGSAGAVFVVILLGYALAQQSATGVFGLSRFSGWPLYGRVATFADCRRFTPPSGTRGLCQDTSASRRPGPDFYIWDSRSPAQRVFGFPPAGGAKLAAFARAAILAQPTDYLSVVGRDVLRYINPYFVHGRQWGTGPSALSLDQRSPALEAYTRPAVRAYYGPAAVRVSVRGTIVNALERLRGIIRIHGWMVALGALLALPGIALAPDRRSRDGLVLLLLGALALLLGSVMVTVYDFRNEIPPGVLLTICGARSAELIARRVSREAPARFRLRLWIGRMRA